MPTALYGDEMCNVAVAEKKRLNIIGIGVRGEKWSSAHGPSKI